MLPALPLWDVLDDEEVLTRPDVAQRPGLAHDHGDGPGPVEPTQERGLLLLQLVHGRDPDGALRPRLEVVVQRPVVEKRNEGKRPNRKPATGDGSSNTPAALLPGHSAGVLRPVPRSFATRRLP